MESEINKQNIIGHIGGLSAINKSEFYILWKKTNIHEKINIIDLDNITDKIINDKNMGLLFYKYENLTLNIKDIKNNQEKIKDIEKKMNLYWKAKMEYYLIKNLKESKKPNLLIGSISYFKNHKINLNLHISTKYFIKVDFNEHVKNIITYNIDNNKNEIINSTFDLNFLDKNFLIKKRLNLMNIYKKLGYNILPLVSTVNSINIIYQVEIPDTFYFCSTIYYEKKISQINNNESYITVYAKEWLAITSPQIDKTNNILSLQKGIKKKKPFVKISNNDILKLKKKFYLYEISDVDIFVPLPSKNEIYKYITSKPIKYNRIIEIFNLFNEFEKLNINIVNI